MTTPPDASDPQRSQVYAAEDEVLTEIGPRLRRWVDVVAFLEHVLSSPDYLEMFPDGPLDITLDRRSRSATASLALPDRRVILIRDGSWNALTVLHELAHLIAPSGDPHGPRFVVTELALVRRWCGFDGYGQLRSAFIRHGVAPTDDSLASAGSPD